MWGNMQVEEQYTSNVISAVELFDILLVYAPSAALNVARINAYTNARTVALEWQKTFPGPARATCVFKRASVALPLLSAVERLHLFFCIFLTSEKNNKVFEECIFI